jgi:hypothetical protein
MFSGYGGMVKTGLARAAVRAHRNITGIKGPKKSAPNPEGLRAVRLTSS